MSTPEIIGPAAGATTRSQENEDSKILCEPVPDEEDVSTEVPSLVPDEDELPPLRRRTSEFSRSMSKDFPAVTVHILPEKAQIFSLFECHEVYTMGRDMLNEQADRRDKKPSSTTTSGRSSSSSKGIRTTLQQLGNQLLSLSRSAMEHRSKLRNLSSPDQKTRDSASSSTALNSSTVPDGPGSGTTSSSTTATTASTSFQFLHYAHYFRAHFLSCSAVSHPCKTIITAFLILLYTVIAYIPFGVGKKFVTTMTPYTLPPMMGSLDARMCRVRAELLKNAHGTVLDFGAGSGVYMKYCFPKTEKNQFGQDGNKANFVHKYIALEPNLEIAAQLKRQSEKLIRECEELLGPQRAVSMPAKAVSSIPPAGKRLGVVADDISTGVAKVDTITSSSPPSELERAAEGEGAHLHEKNKFSIPPRKSSDPELFGGSFGSHFLPSRRTLLSETETPSSPTSSACSPKLPNATALRRTITESTTASSTDFSLPKLQKPRPSSFSVQTEDLFPTTHDVSDVEEEEPLLFRTDSVSSWNKVTSGRGGRSSPPAGAAPASPIQDQYGIQKSNNPMKLERTTSAVSSSSTTIRRRVSTTSSRATAPEDYALDDEMVAGGVDEKEDFYPRKEQHQLDLFENSNNDENVQNDKNYDPRAYNRSMFEENKNIKSNSNTFTTSLGTFPRRRMLKHIPEVEVVTEYLQEYAKRIPENSIDYILLGNALCMVDDVEKILQDLKRLLKPETGRIFFSEHVAALPRNSWRRKRQDWLNPWWARVSDGCNCNRDSLSSMASVFGKDFDLVSFEIDSCGTCPWNALFQVGLGRKK
ncbi:unnamed protein product [Amoebophrya sp. A120]|nr:unnamed protein product [Amoebophrya sp. A120]|eukprot:GSA120T00023216001.1